MPRHHVSHSLPLQQPRSLLSGRPSRSLLPDELQRLASLQETLKAQQGSPPGLQKQRLQGLPWVCVQDPHWGTSLQQLPFTGSPCQPLRVPQESLKVVTPGHGMRQPPLSWQGQPNTLPVPLQDLDSLHARPGTDSAGLPSPQPTQSSSGSQAAQQESPRRQSSLGMFLSGMVHKVRGHSPLSRQSSVAPLLSPPALSAPGSSQKVAASLLTAAVPRAAPLQGLPAEAPALPGPQQAVTGPRATAGATAAAARAAEAMLQGVPAQVPTMPGPHQAPTSRQVGAGATAAATRAGAVPPQPLPAISEVPAQTPTILPTDTAMSTAKGATLARQRCGEVLPLPTPAQARQPPAGTDATSWASSSSASSSDSSSSTGSSTASGSDSDSGSASDAGEAGAAMEGQHALGHLSGMRQPEPEDTKGDAEAPAQLRHAEGATGGGAPASVTAEPAGETGALLQ